MNEIWMKFYIMENECLFRNIFESNEKVDEGGGKKFQGCLNYMEQFDWWIIEGDFFLLFLFVLFWVYKEKKKWL